MGEDRPDTQGEPKLFFRHGYNQGRVEILRGDRVSVGRNPANDIVLDLGRTISSFHAAFVRDPRDGSWWIQDLNSKNGTFVNGVRIKNKRLEEGDVISFATCDIEIEFTTEEIGRVTPDFLAPTVTAEVPQGAFAALLQGKHRKRRLWILAALAACAVLSVCTGLYLFLLRPQRGPAHGPVKLSIDIKPIYGSLFLSYRDRPIGRVEIVNTGTQELGNLKLTCTFLGEAAAFLVVPFEKAVGSIPPGESRTVALTPRLARSILSPVTREVACEIRLSCGEKILARAEVPVFVHGRNVFNWKEPQGIAAFVDPNDPVLKEFVQAVWRVKPPSPTGGFPPEWFRNAVTVVTALANLGLRYLPDSENPISQRIDPGANDRVNYPWETLSSRTGDCDDLSVLFASAFEAVGIPAAVVVCPRHVLVMFESGLDPEFLDQTPIDPATVVSLDGRVWVPLETTVFGKGEAGFAAAWAQGATRKASILSGESNVVVIRKAWQRFQPMPPAPAKTPEPDRWVAPDLPERIAQAFSDLKRYFSANVQKGVAELKKRYPEGPELDRALGVFYTRCGLLDRAREAFMRALFRNSSPPSSEADLVKALPTLPRDVQTAFLLADLGACLSLSARGPEQLSLAARLYKAALDRLPRRQDTPDWAELALRLAAVHRLRGDLASEKQWSDKAFALAPFLKKTYARLVAAQGARAGFNAALERFVLRGLR